MNQPIHWQSAFWGIAALALNTVVQDSGCVLGFLAKYRLILRTSPFVCLFDTCSTMISLATCWRRNSFRRSVQLVAEARGVHESRKKASLTEHVLSIVTFVVATIQFIKLFALKGIPWTQTFGAFYFASYLVQEALYQFGGPLHTEGLLNPDTSAEVEESERARNGSGLGTLAIIVQCLSWLYITGLLFGSSYAEDEGSVTYYTAIAGTTIVLCFPCALLGGFISNLCFVAFCIQVLPSWFLAALLPDLLRKMHPTLRILIPDFLNGGQTSSPEPRLSGSLFTLLITLSVIVIWFSLTYMQLHFLGGFWFGRLFVSLLEKTDFRYIDIAATISNDFWYYACNGFGPILALSGVSFVIGLNTISHHIVLKTFKFIALYFLTSEYEIRDPLELEQFHVKRIKVWAASHFGLMNIGCTILYYSCIYKEQGTFKPSWTENLG